MGEEQVLLSYSTNTTYSSSGSSSQLNNSTSILSTWRIKKWRVLIIVGFYILIATTLPLYNKNLFNYFGYPVTASFLQVVGVVVVLSLYYLALLCGGKYNTEIESWPFRDFLWKCGVLIPVAICFACVMALSNIGLFSVPVNIHVLLKVTNIIWLVLFALIIQKEKPLWYTIISIIGLGVGNFLILYHFTGTKKHSKTAVPIVTNLLSAFCEAVMVVILKKTIAVLHRRDPTISIVEITYIKMLEAFFVLLGITFAVEHVHGFESFAHAHYDVILIILTGVVITLLYQSFVVAVTSVVFAVTVGVLNQIVLVATTLLTFAFFGGFSASPYFIAGTIITICSSMLFAIGNYFVKKSLTTTAEQV